MACAAFEDALKTPDDDASNTRLHELITDGDYSGNNLPYISEDYLHAFCNSNLTYIRRRCVGVALVGMLNASHEIAKHLQVEKWRLQKLGEIILSASEREETKIVAGIIMRQALQDGMEFTSFWPSDKVKDSAPNFPKESGSRWITAFQDFLDALSELALANHVTDASILFPVSVLASDSFRWVSSNNGVPVSIIQEGSLVVLLSDDFGPDIRFLDLPLDHIKSTRTCPSASLHDSQSRTTDHEPWDLILTLEHDHWTYRLDAVKRTATELTIMFITSGDAKECELSIKDVRALSKQTRQKASRHPRMLTSPVLDISSSPPPPQTKGLATQHQQMTGTPIVAKLTARHSGHANFSRAQKRARSPHLPGQSSSDQLGHSPNNEVQSPHGPSNNVHVANLRKRAHQATDVVRPAKKQQSTGPTKGCEKPGATKKLERTSRTQKQGDRMLLQCSEDTEAKQTQKARSKGQGPAYAKPVRAVPKQASSPPNQLNTSAEPAIETTSPPSCSAPGRAVPKRATNSKGKLPKISQATKQKALQPGIFDIPTAGQRKSSVTRQGASETVRLETTKRTRAAPCTKLNITQERKTRNKRKSREDDDEFIPSATKAAKKPGAKRKSIPIVKPLRKKMKIEHEAATADASKNTIRSSTQTGIDHTENVMPEKPKVQPISRGMKSNTTEIPPSSAAFSKKSLIGGLLGLQRPAQTTKSSFKMPALPTRALYPPSTPSHQRIQPRVLQSGGPHTPTEMRKPPNRSLPLLSSSPPGYDVAEEGLAAAQYGTVEREIMSSNSKPTPASPHAESTAISGHADRDDVDLEKQKADLQVAQSNPFKERRAPQAATLFLRRLTGDDLVDKPKSVDGSSYAMPVEIDDLVSSDNEELLVKAASQPLPPPKLDHGRRSSVTKSTKAFSQSPAQADAERLMLRAEVHHVEIQCASNRKDQERLFPTSQSTKRKSVFELHGNDGTPKEKSVVCSEEMSHLERLTVKAQKIEPVHGGEKSDTALENSILVVPPQDIDHTQIECAAETQNELDMDRDATLVDDDSEEVFPTIPNKASHRFRSSPPVPGSPSSHSSTSAAAGPSSPPTVPTSDAEEMEWEANLQPHQRALHDLLIRVSRRVTRHVVDNETAVTDIAEVFANDGEHLLNRLLQRHSSALEGLWEDMETKKTKLKKDMEVSVKALAKERKRVSAQT